MIGKYWPSRLIKQQIQQRPSGSCDPNLLFDQRGKGETSIHSDELPNSTLESQNYSYSTTWSCLSYPNTENKLLFKSFHLKTASLTNLGNSSYDKGIHQTTSLRQKKLSHLNCLGPVSLEEIFLLMNTKTKCFLYLAVFLLIVIKIN